MHSIFRSRVVQRTWAQFLLLLALSLAPGAHATFFKLVGETVDNPYILPLIRTDELDNRYVEAPDGRLHFNLVPLYAESGVPFDMTLTPTDQGGVSFVGLREDINGAAAMTQASFSQAPGALSGAYCGYVAGALVGDTQQDYTFSIGTPTTTPFTLSTANTNVNLHVRFRGGFEPDIIGTQTWSYLPLQGSLEIEDALPLLSMGLTEGSVVQFSANVKCRANFDSGFVALELVDTNGQVLRSTISSHALAADTDVTVPITIDFVQITAAHLGARIRAVLYEWDWTQGVNLKISEAVLPAYTTGPPYLEVTSISGDAEVKVSGGDWAPASTGMHLFQGDQISTGPFSSATLLFPDDSVVTLKEMTEILCSTLLRQGNGLRAQIALRVGEVSATVNPEKVVTSDFSVSSPVATAGVRGTTFTVRYLDLPQPKGMVLVEEGVVEVDPVGAGLPTLDVVTNQVARISSSGIIRENLPVLATVRNGSQMTFSWPVGVPGNIVDAELVASPLLGPAPIWAVPSVPTVSGGFYRITVTPAGSRGYYCLRYRLEN